MSVGFLLFLSVSVLSTLILVGAGTAGLPVSRSRLGKRSNLGFPADSHHARWAGKSPQAFVSCLAHVLFLSMRWILFRLSSVQVRVPSQISDEKIVLDSLGQLDMGANPVDRYLERK